MTEAEQQATDERAARRYRAAFVTMWVQYEDLRRARVHARAASIEAYYVDLIEYFKMAWPKKKLPTMPDEARAKARLAIEPWECYLLQLRRFDEYIQADREKASELRWQEFRLVQLAARAQVRSGDWRGVQRTYSSTYSSQGLGAVSYARANAEQLAAQAGRFAPTRVVTVEERYVGGLGAFGGFTTATFEVQAKVADEGDVQILIRKPSMTLREWLKDCWKRGINPRVLNPFLPDGLEERLGIDYQGNDTKKK